mgnify:CR=1 FL=1
MQVRSVFVESRHWVDRVNNGSYFSNRIHVNGKLVCQSGMQSGFGDRYVYAALENLTERGLLEYTETERTPMLWARSEDIDLYYTAQTVEKSAMFTTLWPHGTRGLDEDHY